ncbi:hypothetical protein SAMN02745146_0095 [Hymenobacter daecheongensis DSM 21074]|uniref:Phage tail tube protein n=1 Tax=Hymenobacter daecheongensis DSM 21074 TaxID=1121955 RepID=A0A1M6LXM9_9BACT|nr:hypothetical protein [Hymenobacter daecheongensis]SHJ76007.1 hypothetical protein SAMN02745146_0095 [Hymenobacter daecheongensis DSM 21074]
MPKPKIINLFGTLTGWNNTNVNLFGRDLEGIEAFKYSDSTEIDVAYGAGGMPIGKTRGNYKAEASISLYVEEVIAIQKQLPKGMRFQDIPDFDVPVTFEHQGSLYTDVVRNCSFKDNGKESKNGEGKMVREYTLVPSHIDYNV